MDNGSNVRDAINVTLTKIINAGHTIDQVVDVASNAPVKFRSVDDGLLIKAGTYVDGTLLRQDLCILLKDQFDTGENGIYTVRQSKDELCLLEFKDTPKVGQVTLVRQGIENKHAGLYKTSGGMFIPWRDAPVADVGQAIQTVHLDGDKINYVAGSTTQFLNKVDVGGDLDVQGTIKDWKTGAVSLTVYQAPKGQSQDKLDFVGRSNVTSVHLNAPTYEHALTGKTAKDRLVFYFDGSLRPKLTGVPVTFYLRTSHPCKAALDGGSLVLFDVSPQLSGSDKYVEYSTQVTLTDGAFRPFSLVLNATQGDRPVHLRLDWAAGNLARTQVEKDHLACNVPVAPPKDAEVEAVKTVEGDLRVQGIVDLGNGITLAKGDDGLQVTSSGVLMNLAGPMTIANAGETLSLDVEQQEERNRFQLKSSTPMRFATEGADILELAGDKSTLFGDVRIAGALQVDGGIHQDHFAVDRFSIGHIGGGGGGGGFAQSTRLAVFGSDTRSEDAANLGFYSYRDEHPLFLVEALAHDNVALKFDPLGGSDTQFAIGKNKDKVALTYGNTTTRANALTVDCQTGDVSYGDSTVGDASGGSHNFYVGTLGGGGGVNLIPKGTVRPQLNMYNNPFGIASVVGDRWTQTVMEDGTWTLGGGDMDDVALAVSKEGALLAGSFGAPVSLSTKRDLNVGGSLLVAGDASCANVSILGDMETHSATVRGDVSVAGDLTLGGCATVGSLGVTKSVDFTTTNSDGSDGAYRELLVLERSATIGTRRGNAIVQVGDATEMAAFAIESPVGEVFRVDGVGNLTLAGKRSTVHLGGVSLLKVGGEDALGSAAVVLDNGSSSWEIGSSYQSLDFSVDGGRVLRLAGGSERKATVLGDLDCLGSMQGTTLRSNAVETGGITVRGKGAKGNQALLLSDDRISFGGHTLENSLGAFQVNSMEGTPLLLNCSLETENAPLVLNRKNRGGFSVYHGDDQILAVNDAFKGLQVLSGDVSVKGSLIADGVRTNSLDAERITLTNLTGKGSYAQFAVDESGLAVETATGSLAVGKESALTGHAVTLKGNDLLLAGTRVALLTGEALRATFSTLDTTQGPVKSRSFPMALGAGAMAYLGAQRFDGWLYLEVESAFGLSTFRFYADAEGDVLGDVEGTLDPEGRVAGGLSVQVYQGDSGDTGKIHVYLSVGKQDKQGKQGKQVEEGGNGGMTCLIRIRGPAFLELPEDQTGGPYTILDKHEQQKIDASLLAWDSDVSPGRRLLASQRMLVTNDANIGGSLTVEGKVIAPTLEVDSIVATGVNENLYVSNMDSILLLDGTDVRVHGSILPLKGDVGPSLGSRPEPLCEAWLSKQLTVGSGTGDVLTAIGDAKVTRLLTAQKISADLIASKRAAVDVLSVKEDLTCLAAVTANSGRFLETFADRGAFQEVLAQSATIMGDLKVGTLTTGGADGLLAVHGSTLALGGERGFSLGLRDRQDESGNFATYLSAPAAIELCPNGTKALTLGADGSVDVSGSFVVCGTMAVGRTLTATDVSITGEVVLGEKLHVPSIFSVYQTTLDGNPAERILDASGGLLEAFVPIKGNRGAFSTLVAEKSLTTESVHCTSLNMTNAGLAALTCDWSKDETNFRMRGADGKPVAVFGNQTSQIGGSLLVRKTLETKVAVKSTLGAFKQIVMGGHSNSSTGLEMTLQGNKSARLDFSNSSTSLANVRLTNDYGSISLLAGGLGLTIESGSGILTVSGQLSKFKGMVSVGGDVLVGGSLTFGNARTSGISLKRDPTAVAYDLVLPKGPPDGKSPVNVLVADGRGVMSFVTVSDLLGASGRMKMSNKAVESLTDESRVLKDAIAKLKVRLAALETKETKETKETNKVLKSSTETTPKVSPGDVFGVEEIPPCEFNKKVIYVKFHEPMYGPYTIVGNVCSNSSSVDDCYVCTFHNLKASGVFLTVHKLGGTREGWSETGLSVHYVIHKST